MEIYRVTPLGLVCTCVPEFGSGTTPNPSRITVSIKIDDGDNGTPSVRANEVTVDDSTATIHGISAAEVTHIEVAQ